MDQITTPAICQGRPPQAFKHGFNVFSVDTEKNPYKTNANSDSSNGVDGMNTWTLKFSSHFIRENESKRVHSLYKPCPKTIIPLEVF